MRDTPHTRFSRPARDNDEVGFAETIPSSYAGVKATASEKPATHQRAQGAGLSGHRLIWTIAGIATVCLVAGVVLGRFIISPAQAAADAEPPTPGLITVPVESRVVSNSVTTRGDVTYADSIEVTIEAPEGGSGVVTGQVPGAGATLDAGSVALEVEGRPVIVLPGELPVYRSLSVGLSGPDVLQLKQALKTLGIGTGRLDSDLFDAKTAAGVTALYQRVGYTPPATDGATGDAPDGSEVALTSLPSGEVLYLNNLPRRVDNVTVKRGGILEGAAMTVSGATLQVSANVSEADSKLLSPGMKAEFAAPGGDAITAEVLSVGKKQQTKDESGEARASGTAARYEVQLKPGDLTDEQLTALKNSNVKITIPVSATTGAVLAVPLAALTAGPGGESRVEIVTDEEKEETELVTVTTGLAADGFVEVSADGQTPLTEGAQVVVGR